MNLDWKTALRGFAAFAVFMGICFIIAFVQHRNSYMTAAECRQKIDKLSDGDTVVLNGTLAPNDRSLLRDIMKISEMELGSFFLQDESGEIVVWYQPEKFPQPPMMGKKAIVRANVKATNFGGSFYGNRPLMYRIEYVE